MDLAKRGVRILTEQGLKTFFGKSFCYIGNHLTQANQTQRKKEIIQKYKQDVKYLNVGGGTFVRENWRVLDMYSEWYDYDSIYMDFNINLEELSEWPIDDNDYDIVYSQYTLEHLSDEAIKKMLSESYRILKPGGVIRIGVPNMDLVIEHYESENIEWFEKVAYKNDDIVDNTSQFEEFKPEIYLLHRFARYLVVDLLTETDYRQVRSDYIEMNNWQFFQKYSNKIKDRWQDENPGYHRNWFTHNRLSELLRDSGFKNITKTSCRQSRTAELCHEQFDKHPYQGLYIEAKK
jgi:predicted SAM-dependent methyltransferase